MKQCFFTLILCSAVVLAQTLTFTNGPMDTTVCMGSFAIISCGFENVSNLFIPSWRIIKRSDDGSVISDMTVSTTAINNDDSDGLQYIPDTTSGMNMSPNSRLLVGPVDETDNQSSYQCIFAIGLDMFESNIGTLTVTEIPPVVNLIAVDQCSSVTASWDNPEGPCRVLSYNVILSSSDGVTIGPFTTSDTIYTFTGVDTINGNISVDVFAFNDNAKGGDVTKAAIIDVSLNDLPTANNVRSVSRICLTSFTISWDASNSITCGDVSYEVSISPPPIEGNAVATTFDRFYSVTGLNNSLPNVVVKVTARNRAGHGKTMMYHVQLPVPLEPPPVTNLRVIVSDDDIAISFDRPNIDDCTTLPITCYTIFANVTFENDDTQVDYTCMFYVSGNNMDRFEIRYNECFDVNFVRGATYNIGVSTSCDISQNTTPASGGSYDDDNNHQFVTFGIPMIVAALLFI